ncbi:MAG: carboxypeptidase-like regulatory domain-containing protein [Sphingobacteriales bacterium]|nr:carboxypeptidase-like regulatory domain-containing protein [Sphingobacteriales bacterium]
MKNSQLTILLVFLSSFCYAQTFVIKGVVKDTEKHPIPFATVFIKDGTIGTSANVNGEYTLKVKGGKYEISYSAVGFKSIVKALTVNDNVIIDATLSVESYILKDVIVTNAGEDPAYSIIRKAIAARKKHLKETPPYHCDVYIKGVQRLLKTPEKFLGKDLNKPAQEVGLDSNRTGIVYQSESQSVLSFSPPNYYHEEMVSSKVAGNNRSFSFNRATELILNFYKNYQDWTGLSNRPFVSPIADNALFYYDYKLIGSTIENGELINKIQLIPKRNYDPVYHGYIYIIEDSWRIFATNFLMSKESNIAILDSLKIEQQFIHVGKKNWMPSIVKFKFTGGFLGFRFGGNYIGVYSDYELNPNYQGTNFKEVLKITKDVNKKDSTYWKNARPIPLTQEEVANYQLKDSIARKRESKPYLDSLDRVNNKLKPFKLLLGGYNPRDRYQQKFYHIDGFLNALSYNTVEGFVINYGAYYNKKVDTVNNRYLFWSGKLRYGFSNKLFNANSKLVLPVFKQQTLSFYLGSDVTDLNDKGSLNILENSINSLLYEKNFSKFYQKKFGEVTLSSAIIGGMTGSLGFAYQSNKWLPNTSNYSIKNYANRDFTSNNPFSPSSDVSLFKEYQNFNLKLGLSYNFSNKYATYPTGKYYLPSKWPTLNLQYEKGISGIFGSDESYDFLSLGLRKSDIKLGFYGSFSFSTEVGKFLNSDKIYYPDFKHFTGNQALFFSRTQNQFLFLSYYLQSTSNEYLEFHAEHNFSGFFTNKIPLIRKLKLQELVGFNYLTIPTFKNYKELYFGFSYIGIKAYYGFAFEGNRQVQSGFRIAFGL